MTSIFRPAFTAPDVLAPILVSGLFIAAMSLLREPARRTFSALLARFLGHTALPVRTLDPAFRATLFRGLRDMRYRNRDLVFLWRADHVWCVSE